MNFLLFICMLANEAIAYKKKKKRNIIVIEYYVCLCTSKRKIIMFFFFETKWQFNGKKVQTVCGFSLVYTACTYKSVVHFCFFCFYLKLYCEIRNCNGKKRRKTEKKRNKVNVLIWSVCMFSFNWLLTSFFFHFVLRLRLFFFLVW